MAVETSCRGGWLDARVIKDALLESETSVWCPTSMLCDEGPSERDIVSSLVRPLDSEVPKSILSSPNCTRANPALVAVATEAKVSMGMGLATFSNDWLNPGALTSILCDSCLCSSTRDDTTSLRASSA